MIYALIESCVLTWSLAVPGRAEKTLAEEVAHWVCVFQWRQEGRAFVSMEEQHIQSLGDQKGLAWRFEEAASSRVA